MEKDTKIDPSSLASLEPWDTTFNRATNVYKDRDKSKAPTLDGRVSGLGTSMKFLEYYNSSDMSETKTERRRTVRAGKTEVLELKNKLQTLEKEKVDTNMVNKLVDERLRAFLPTELMEGIAAWHAGGQKGPIHVPSFSGSNSTMNQSPVTPTTNADLPFVAPTPPLAKDTEAPPPEQLEENVRPVAHIDALVSTLAEINAVDKVTH